MSDKTITELAERAARVLRIVRSRDTMVEVNLDLSPSLPTVLGETRDEALIVLLRRREVGVEKRTTVDVSMAVRQFRVLATPALEPALLLVARRQQVRRRG